MSARVYPGAVRPTYGYSIRTKMTDVVHNSPFFEVRIQGWIPFLSHHCQSQFHVSFIHQTFHIDIPLPKTHPHDDSHVSPKHDPYAE